jgi:hypothetical protein
MPLLRLQNSEKGQTADRQTRESKVETDTLFAAPYDH